MKTCGDTSFEINLRLLNWAIVVHAINIVLIVGYMSGWMWQSRIKTYNGDSFLKQSASVQLSNCCSCNQYVLIVGYTSGWMWQSRTKIYNGGAFQNQSALVELIWIDCWIYE